MKLRLCQYDIASVEYLKSDIVYTFRITRCKGGMYAGVEPEVNYSINSVTIDLTNTLILGKLDD